MSIYAQIADRGDGTLVVVEIFPAVSDKEGNEIPVSDRFTPAFIDTLIDITNTSPEPQVGWTYNGSSFAAP